MSAYLSISYVSWLMWQWLVKVMQMHFFGVRNINVIMLVIKIVIEIKNCPLLVHDMLHLILFQKSKTL